MTYSVFLLAFVLVLLPANEVLCTTPFPDCIGICTYNITSNGSTLATAPCSQLLEAQQCFMDRPVLCNLTRHAPLSPELTTLSLIKGYIVDGNCVVPAETTPPSALATAPPTQNCPPEFIQSPGSVVNVSIVPQGEIGSECRNTNSDRNKQLQHCSLFLDGYLRTFPAYRHGLQGCSLPGSWILFRHDKLQVEVEGSPITLGQVRLTKVNVTIFPDACNGNQLRSYVAQSFTSLPTSFTNGHTPSNSGSSLQLNVSPDRSVVSILMVYSNFTIIIRRVSLLLSVTLQVPGRDSFFSDGLCSSSCPRQQAVNLTSLARRFQDCPQHWSVQLSCFTIPAFTRLLTIINASYYDVCTPAIYQAFSGSASTFMNGVGMDAINLPDDDVFPGRPLFTTVPNRPETTPTIYQDTTPTLSDETEPQNDVTTSISGTSTEHDSPVTDNDISTKSGPLLGDPDFQSGFHLRTPLSWLLVCLLVISLLW